MPRLNVAPTKSNLLALKRQLAFAEEGYDLLEQKRRLVVLELFSRLSRAREVETKVIRLVEDAFASLREAELDVGSSAIDRAGLGVKMNHHVIVSLQRRMGLRIPRVEASPTTSDVHFGVLDTSASTDLAMYRFVQVLVPLSELAEQQTALARLAQELRKTQRRCNALSKVFMPNCRDTISYILGTLEERERESFVILKMIRNRLVRLGDG